MENTASWYSTLSIGEHVAEEEAVGTALAEYHATLTRPLTTKAANIWTKPKMRWLLRLKIQR